MSHELSLAERAKIERNRQNALLKLEKKRRYVALTYLVLNIRLEHFL